MKNPAVFSIGPEIRFLRAISTAELERFRSAISHFVEFGHGRRLIGIIEGNQADFDAALKRFREIRPLEPSPTSAPEIAFELNRHLLNYLSAVRVYLDHMDGRLKHRYASTGGPTIAFQEAKRRAYDTAFAYRFFYRLRNFAQHSGLPLNVVRSRKSIRKEQDGTESAEYLLEVGFDSQQLLRDFGSWGMPVKSELQLGPHIIPVEPLISDVTSELLRIDAAVREAEKESLRSAALDLFEVVGEHINQNAFPVVGELVPLENGDHDFHYIEPPYDLLKELGFGRATRILNKRSGEVYWSLTSD